MKDFLKILGLGFLGTITLAVLLASFALVLYVIHLFIGLGTAGAIIITAALLVAGYEEIKREFFTE